MYSRRHTARVFHALLLAAFVHQMNACRCGHLDHNGWAQLVGQLCSDGTDQDRSDGSAVSHDCDADELPYVVASSDSAETLLAVADLSARDQDGHSLWHLTFAHRAPDFSAPRVALGVRAQLQVFLL